MSRDTSIVTYGDEHEPERRQQLVDLLRGCPIPDNELAMNMGIFLTPQTLSRVLFMDFLYRQALDVQGVVMEFGCRWGQNVSLFTALRGIYEPFNRLRKIVAFDSFAGFPSVSPEDGEQMRQGAYAVSENYETYLAAILDVQEKESPLSHLKKHEIVKGDVVETLPPYLERNPETVVALAYFDLDLHGPTLESLRAIEGRLTRGSVIGFDEVNDHATPGETLALMEAFGLKRYALRRYRHSARTSYLIVE
jgi:hypothetical protein